MKMSAGTRESRRLELPTKAEVDALRTKAAPHLKKLEAIEVKGDKVPTEALNALSELVKLTPQVRKLRSGADKDDRGEGPQARATCEQLNTTWNAFKSLLGFCDPWGECVKQEFGCTSSTAKVHNCC
jgi:hypothetical protein